MKERILAILAIGVTVLIIYTLTFRTKTLGVKVVSPHSSEAVATQVSRSPKKQEVTPSEKQPVSSSSSEKTEIATEAVEWGSDPFVRDWILFSEVANLNLRAITITTSGASALINNQILQVGDEINRKRVVKIEEDKVILEQGGRTFTLTLGE
ncbi:MAG: hypothetical protein ABIK39_02325 [candidate division WOR-3 bacterium]